MVTGLLAVGALLAAAMPSPDDPVWRPTVAHAIGGEDEAYSPPLLANGDIAFRVGPFGDNATLWCEKGWTPPIYREGRREGSERQFMLKSYGNYRLGFTVDGKAGAGAARWEQTLDLYHGEAVGRITLSNGVVLTTTAAVPLGIPAIVVRREIVGAKGEIEQVLDYDGPGLVANRRVKGATASWAIVFPDGQRPSVGPVSPEAMFQSNRLAWASFWSRTVPPPEDPALRRCYLTALYHLRCNATAWSQPVGISNDTWAGRYFAWDEFFCQMGLLYTGHADLSRRVSEFRAAILPSARARVWHDARESKYGAAYPWETLEDGGDGTPPGQWNAHVFHGANVVEGAWNQYVRTGDGAFLRTVAWPLARDIARYYITHVVYEDARGGRFVGRVTDLERFGPAKERAFMTTCGVIGTFETAAEIAMRIGEAGDEAKSWRETAESLRKSLPERDGAYRALPEPDLDVESVAVVAGYFPYRVFGPDDVRARAALRHFDTVAAKAGNMYACGEKVCSWYAAWISAAASRAGEREMAIKWAKVAAESVGLFGECWEIREGTKVRSRPWFATASGMFAFACALTEAEPFAVDRSAMSDRYWEVWNDGVQRQIDADIEANRKSDGVFEVGADDGTEVRVEQIDHEFRFGAHIFNFDQLGKSEWNDAYKQSYGQGGIFNQATVAFYWNKYEPVPNRLRACGDYEDTARFWDSLSREEAMDHPFWRRPAPGPVVSYLRGRGVRIHGHILVWGLAKPDWIYDWYCPEDEKRAFDGIGIPRNDGRAVLRDKSWSGVYNKAWRAAWQKLNAQSNMTEEAIAALAPTFAKRMTELFRKRVFDVAGGFGEVVDSWDVVNESSGDWARYRKSRTGLPVWMTWYGLMPGDYPLRALLDAKAAFPEKAKLAINDWNIGDDFLAQVKDLEREGAKIDIIGCQMHLFDTNDCMRLANGETRVKWVGTPEAIQEHLDLMARAGRPLHISEVTIAAPGSDGRARMIQAVLARNIYRKWFSHKAVMGITWWNTVDGGGVKGEPLVSGLFTSDLKKKPAYLALEQLINKEWTTKLSVPAKDGKIAFRGFCGRYRLTWKDAGGKDCAKFVELAAPARR